MEISTRLKTIASMVDNCRSIADIGTDHGYLPIYLVKQGVCHKAIACDINKGPLQKAKNNINIQGLSDKITCRLGGGLNTIESFEVECAVIAGMGGNLIRDIIEEKKEIFKNLKYAILQPVQNPEVLRKYIYDNGYEIIDEELCLEENKYYEIIKVRFNNIERKSIDNIFYEVSEILVQKKHSLIDEFIRYKIKNYKKILSFIDDDTIHANNRKEELNLKILKLEDLLK